MFTGSIYIIICKKTMPITGTLKDIVTAVTVEAIRKNVRNHYPGTMLDPCCVSCKCPGKLVRTLKNGKTQVWCKDCLDTYRKDRDELREEAIAEAGGIEAAKRSMKLSGGPDKGMCMDCGEPVNGFHDRITTSMELRVHTGCL